MKSFVKVPVKKGTNEDCESYYVSINQIRTLKQKASGLVYFKCSDNEIVKVEFDECERKVITIWELNTIPMFLEKTQL